MLELTKLNKKELQDLFAYLDTYKMEYQSTIGVPSSYSFGLELEFERLRLNKAKEEIKKINKDYLVVEDESVCEMCEGSLFGGEASSPILHDTVSDWKSLRTVADAITSLGGVAGSSTGGHIHIGAQILKEDIRNLVRLVKLWSIFEPTIYRFSYGESSKARPKIDYFAIPMRSIYIALYKKNRSFFNNISATKEFDFGKRMGISFKNYHYLSDEEIVNNTIEVRCPNGSLNPIVIQNNVNFFLKLMQYVTSDNYDEARINRMFSRLIDDNIDYSAFNLKQALMLADLIFEREFDKINFLSGYLKREDYVLLRK